MPDEDYESMVDELSTVIAQAEQDGGQATGLRNMRKALRRSAKAQEEAEQRGYQRALTEQTSKSVLDTRGIPAALRGLFTGTDLSDSAAVDAKVKELQDQGLTWQTPSPQPQPAGAPQPQGQGAPSAAAQQPVPPALANALASFTPEQMQALKAVMPGVDVSGVLAAQTSQMQQAAAGGTPAGATGDLEARIRAAAANPGAVTAEQRQALAAELNKELDHFSAAQSATFGNPLG